ncbi:hypothetical protein XELAEV_18037415mg [Xenopus laevis]|uniref:Uncharacterized protein n=1 Tax=Xenopus laevis TaxID=8355 RepID=A0A974CC39_XENLA|nr:hypothetical protein XELAEV_18037415mg [Xenopus laevis]
MNPVNLIVEPQKCTNVPPPDDKNVIDESPPCHTMYESLTSSNAISMTCTKRPCQSQGISQGCVGCSTLVKGKEGRVKRPQIPFVTQFGVGGDAVSKILWKHWGELRHCRMLANQQLDGPYGELLILAIFLPVNEMKQTQMGNLYV